MHVPSKEHGPESHSSSSEINREQSKPITKPIITTTTKTKSGTSSQLIIQTTVAEWLQRLTKAFDHVYVHYQPVDTGFDTDLFHR